MRHLFEIAVAITALSLMAINNPTPAYAAVGGNVIINIDIPTQEETLPETEPETTVQETETEPETTVQETETEPSTEVETTAQETTQEAKRHHDYDDDTVCLPDGDIENDLIVYKTIQDSSLPQETETTVPETPQDIPQPVLPKMGEENTAIDAFWVAFAVAGLVGLSSGIVYAVRRK